MRRTGGLKSNPILPSFGIDLGAVLKQQLNTCRFATCCCCLKGTPVASALLVTCNVGPSLQQ